MLLQEREILHPNSISQTSTSSTWTTISKFRASFFDMSNFVKIDQHFCLIFDQFACVVKIRCWQVVLEPKTGIIWPKKQRKFWEIYRSKSVKWAPWLEERELSCGRWQRCRRSRRSRGCCRRGYPAAVTWRRERLRTASTASRPCGSRSCTPRQRRLREASLPANSPPGGQRTGNMESWLKILPVEVEEEEELPAANGKTLASNSIRTGSNKWTIPPSSPCGGGRVLFRAKNPFRCWVAFDWHTGDWASLGRTFRPESESPRTNFGQWKGWSIRPEVSW